MSRFSFEANDWRRCIGAPDAERALGIGSSKLAFGITGRDNRLIGGLSFLLYMERFCDATHRGFIFVQPRGVVFVRGGSKFIDFERALAPKWPPEFPSSGKSRIS